jgi:hypothetical protein
MALIALRAAVAVGVSAALTALIMRELPRSLDVSTGIVGNPIYSNFNVNRYLWVYGLWMLFPFVALAVDVALSRLLRGRLPPAVWPVLRPPANPGPQDRSVAAVGGARTAFLGTVLGTEIAIGAVLDGSVFLLAIVAVTALYCAFAAGVALVAPLRSRTFWERLAAVNVLSTPLTVLGLYGVSRATQVQVLENGRLYEYPWLPFWLAVVATAVLSAVLVSASRRARSGSDLRLVERRSLLWLAAPVFLFLVVARLPGEIGPIDSFHEGEVLSAADLTATGAVPWRDLMFVHGLLHDVVAPLIGLSVFEDTRWGHFAGLLMLVGPAYFLVQYFLFLYLFRDNVLFLLGTQVAVVLGLFAGSHFRFVLMPIALLLLAALLRRASWARAAALAGVLVVQAVLSPETTIAIPALAGIVGFFELWAYDRTRPLLVNFRRTGQLIGSGAVTLAVVFVVLAALRILDDFVFFYRTFLSEHVLTGGIPVQWWDNQFYFAAFAPPILVILTVWFFAVARRAGRSPRIDDWVMAGLAVTVLLYYPKFLGRADYPHLDQVLPVAAPLIAYGAYRVLSLIEGRRWAAWATAAAVTLAALLSPTPILDRAEAIPERVSVEAQFDPDPLRIGFLSPNATSLEMMRDVGWILDHYLGPSGEVFDFSNNPFLFHYVLDRQPASRYFHVSMAIRRGTQSDLIRELERRKPKLVVSATYPRFGLPDWDGIPNQVRHYDVSEYILDHYRPLLASQGWLFMARNGSGLRPPPRALEGALYERPATDVLYFRTLRCNWGYAPNFLSTGPAEDEAARAVELRMRPTDGVFTVSGWAADLDAKAPAMLVVAALGRRVYGQATPATERPDIAGGLGDERFARSGFRMIIPAVVPLQQLRVYGLTRDGTARELVYGPGSGLAPLSRTPDRVVLGGRSFRVIPGGIHGWAESAEGEKPTWALELPPGSAPADYDWLEFRTRTRFEDDTLWITDSRGDPERAISLKTLDRGQLTIRVQVAACSQWRGLGRSLYLESANGQELGAVRLIP